MATMQTRAILQQIEQLFGAGTVAGLSDAQLVGRFLDHRDEAAFVALVARHGPMVLTVCRGVLRDAHDAEDAFQATFLILARKAGAVRVGESLDGWLHRVAYRVALQASRDAARRRSRERKAGEAAVRQGVHEGLADESRAILHSEIGRLPDRFRLPVLLCDLEGLTRDQAASRLRWSEGTVRGRLAKARMLLRRRLVRRGVGLPAGALATILGSEAAMAAVPVPNALLTATAPVATGQAVGLGAASLTARVFRAMLLSRLKKVTAILLTAGVFAGASAVVLLLAVQASVLLHVAGVATKLPFREDMPIEGRVVDLEGRPVQGATVKVTSIWAPNSGDLSSWIRALKGKESDIYTIRSRYLSETVEVDGNVVMLDPQLVPSTTTDARGEFRLTGIGRERLAELNIEAPSIRSTGVTVMTRRGEPFQVPWDPRMPDGNKSNFYDASIQLAVAPSRPIEGFVRDRATGVPIVGATISSYAFADEHVFNSTEISTTSAADGHYRIAGMPRGSGNQLAASSPPGQPYLPVVEEIADPPGLGPIRHDILLTRGVTIEGRVQGMTNVESFQAYVCYHAASENPELDSAPGFRLTRHGDYTVRARTGENGTFTIAGLPGRGLLLVEVLAQEYPGIARQEVKTLTGYVPEASNGFYHAYARIDVPRGVERFHQDLSVDPGRSLAGTVLDPDGKPLSGAYAYGLFNLGAWNPVEGSSFEVHAIASPGRAGKKAAPPASRRTLVFQHDARKLAGWVEVDGKKPGPLVVRLKSWAAVSGRVVDEEGNPRANLAFLIAIPDKPRLGGGYITHRPERGLTDADGRYRIEGLVPGLNYRLFPDAPTGKTSRRINFTPKSAGEDRDLGTATIEFVDFKD